MHLGLIGGIGPAATDYYYRWLIKEFEARGRDLELTIVHAATSTLLQNLMAGDVEAQAEILARLSQRLAGAGAEAVAVTSIAGHFCSEAFEARSALPVLDLVISVDNGLRKAGYKTVGILGTKAVMQSGMYGRLSTVDILSPEGENLEAVHQCYVDMATTGVVTDAQRQMFFDCGRRLCDEQGAEAVLLGGTDLFLAFDGRDCGFKVVDCALLHLKDLAIAAAR